MEEFTIENEEISVQKSTIRILKDIRGRAACVVEGTRVLLKDGLEKPIEEIQPFTATSAGDEIMSIEGSIVYPVAMIAGPEQDFPVVVLEVETSKKKYKVKVSKWHSLMRNYYSMVQAYVLKPGDKLLTSTGTGTVTSVSFEAYQGDVWNIFLASEEFKDNLKDMTLDMIYTFRRNSLLGLKPKEHIMLTDGLASGSFVMQMQLIDFARDGVNINNFA